jgi:GT2 family glycosyltransferase
LAASRNGTPGPVRIVPPIDIVAVMTVFNRREQTVECLRSLHASAARAPGISIAVCLTDDGSTDGTAAAVRREFPDTRILAGTGSLYWNGGMRLAMDEAITLAPAHYLWINDDVVLDADAIPRLLDVARTASAGGQCPIIVGSTTDTDGTITNYGGRVRRHRLRPLHFSLVEPAASEPVSCETMNANCVLLSAAAVERVGNLDPVFIHCLGDFDYGLRAAQLGCRILVCPGHVGRCTRGGDRGDSTAAFRSVRAAWRSVAGPKAYPPDAWRTFTRRYGGPFWPAYWVKPYLKAVFVGLLRGGLG